MDKRRELARLAVLGVLLAVVLVSFFYLLYDLQVNRREEFQARMVKAVGRAETVPAARGEITDRYGRPLVTNRVIYQVTLNTSLMGERRDEILLELMDLATQEGITWPDNLPLRRQAPYTLDRARLGETALKNYDALAEKLGWTATGGAELLAQLRQTYHLSDQLTAAQVRDLGGVLYELSLREQEITWEAYVFAKDVDIDFISAVREWGLSGVTAEPVTARKYNTTYAAHILGHTGDILRETWPTYKEQGYAMNAKVGIDGVEKAFEALLRGQSGTQLVERNANGKAVSQTWVREPQPGKDVALTIDLPLQQKVEDVLAETLPGLGEDVEGGAAAMLDVNTGAVLALASYPTYDLSVYQDSARYQELLSDPLRPLNDRATSGLYPPGSTFKPVVAAGALEEGIITPSTLIRDTGRYTYYKSPQPQCWIYRQYGSTHGNVNVTKAIEVSCNVFFYDVGRRLGIQKIDEYAARFGLGQATGIELPENTGVVAGPEYTEKVLGQTWYDGSTLSAAIGQENNQFTPLQLANYTATLANGGTRYAVHLLQSVKTPGSSDPAEEYQPRVVDQLDLDPASLSAVTQGMLNLTTTGSLGSYFRDLPFQVAAKTGSAQVSAQTDSNAVFVCFAPYDDPQVALALVVEKGGSGSGLAAMAADILDFYFSAQSGFSTAVEENVLLR